MRRVDAQPVSVRVRRRLHREAPVPERELHVGHAHDRPGVDGSADPGLARADRVGPNLRTPRPLGLLVDDCSTQAPGWDVVADQPVGDLLTNSQCPTSNSQGWPLEVGYWELGGL